MSLFTSNNTKLFKQSGLHFLALVKGWALLLNGGWKILLGYGLVEDPRASSQKPPSGSGEGGQGLHLRRPSSTPGAAAIPLGSPTGVKVI
jgi:hypothetical protein